MNRTNETLVTTYETDFCLVEEGTNSASALHFLSIETVASEGVLYTPYGFYRPADRQRANSSSMIHDEFTPFDEGEDDFAPWGRPSTDSSIFPIPISWTESSGKVSRRIRKKYGSNSRVEIYYFQFAVRHVHIHFEGEDKYGKKFSCEAECQDSPSPEENRVLADMNKGRSEDNRQSWIGTYDNLSNRKSGNGRDRPHKAYNTYGIWKHCLEVEMGYKAEGAKVRPVRIDVWYDFYTFTVYRLIREDGLVFEYTTVDQWTWETSFDLSNTRAPLRELYMGCGGATDEQMGELHNLQAKKKAGERLSKKEQFRLNQLLNTKEVRVSLFRDKMAAQEAKRTRITGVQGTRRATKDERALLNDFRKNHKERPCLNGKVKSMDGNSSGHKWVDYRKVYQ